MTWTLHSRRPLPGGASASQPPAPEPPARGAPSGEPSVAGGPFGGAPSNDTWTLSWDTTAVMGIVNVTPDSFSDGGEVKGTAEAIDRGCQLARDGALIIDVGGESTRPGSHPVDLDLELERVIPVVAGLAARQDVVISVDTRKPAVAAAALEAGAHLVNDVGGLRDPAMVDVCAAAGAPAVIMHMQGEPATMQDRPTYGDVVEEVRAELHQRAEMALARGVPSVVVDPGIGFGKTLQHNLALLRAIDRFGPYPVLIGASRKGMINALSPTPDPHDRLPGTLATHLWAAAHGAALVRAHDVAAHVQALKVWQALEGGTA